MPEPERSEGNGSWGEDVPRHVARDIGVEVWTVNENPLTVSLDESLKLLEVNLLFGTSSTHCLFDLLFVGVLVYALVSQVISYIEIRRIFQD
jgi:hypothetical protein